MFVSLYRNILLFPYFVDGCIYSECSKVKKSHFLSHLLVAGCDIGIQISVHPSVSQSTIYIKVFLCSSDRCELLSLTYTLSVHCDLVTLTYF